MKNQLFGIGVESLSALDIREKIKKYIFQSDGRDDFIHIVSLNAENIVIAKRDHKFKQVLTTAQIKIFDSIGVYVTGRLLGVRGTRIAGVDLMRSLFSFAAKERLRVVLIGGKKNIAERVIDCQKQEHYKFNCRGIEGISDIRSPTPQEEKNIDSIVADYKPHLVFVAFGSPFQELWIDRHRKRFRGMVCMGVGGAFDYLSEAVPRAPLFLRWIGGEWVFRLFVQPWRIKRYMRLVSFIGMTIHELFKK